MKKHRDSNMNKNCLVFIVFLTYLPQEMFLGFNIKLILPKIYLLL